jgi:hypothetical protein
MVGATTPTTTTTTIIIIIIIWRYLSSVMLSTVIL